MQNVLRNFNGNEVTAKIHATIIAFTKHTMIPTRLHSVGGSAKECGESRDADFRVEQILRAQNFDFPNILQSRFFPDLTNRRIHQLFARIYAACRNLRASFWCINMIENQELQSVIRCAHDVNCDPLAPDDHITFL